MTLYQVLTESQFSVGMSFSAEKSWSEHHIDLPEHAAALFQIMMDRTIKPSGRGVDWPDAHLPEQSL